MNPRASTEEQLRKFLFYTLEEGGRHMLPGVDKYIILTDFKGSGLSNINLSQMKDMAPIIQDCYTERMYMMISINVNFLLRTVWTLLKPFLDEITIRKYTFISKNVTEELLKYIDEDTLPQEYGGRSSFKFTPVN
eukprot:TRINITY_DN1338_c0_g2_i1.p2 TRINITY_DN1338_c0_g2~~TRINITY_DN1338_c0_g2_i1.p2  ORF type:complete len:135 (+),score=22.23 TRINITY_DN1338_c0_g2_i1:1378-1782(+)